MDFELPPHVIEFRDTVKRIIREVVTPEMIDEMHRSGTFNSYALNRALALLKETGLTKSDVRLDEPFCRLSSQNLKG